MKRIKHNGNMAHVRAPLWYWICMAAFAALSGMGIIHCATMQDAKAMKASPAIAGQPPTDESIRQAMEDYDYHTGEYK